MTAAAEPPIRLIAGLGNPGPNYAKTRHNAGFLVLDELARRHGLRFRRGKHAQEAKAPAPLGVTLIKPDTFMNLSGTALQAYASMLRLRPEEMVLVHDDLDLPFGRLRLKTAGGAGGQGGVKDTIAKVGAGFHRLKLGIDRPPPGRQVEAWVLSRFADDEGALLAQVVGAAADALELVLSEGMTAAMNRYNGLDLRPAVAPQKP